MIRTKTVFVLGAGASKEVGLPTGAELKNIIAKKLDLRFDFDRPVGSGDYNIYDVLRKAYGRQTNEYLHVGRAIHDGIILSDSIDDFIDNHQHDPRISVCGKLAIARSILEAEKRSKIYLESRGARDTINWSGVDDTWFSKFYRLLVKGIKNAERSHIFDNVTIINFNYDRCLEHFLTYALSTHQIITQADALELVKSARILRPYGSVGSYFPLDSMHVPFGSDNLPSVENIMGNLRTYTEQIEDEKELQLIRESLKEAKAIIFLGMAYHPNNMNLLSGPPREKPKQSRPIPQFFATKKGIPKGDLSIVCKRLELFCVKAPHSTPLEIEDIRFADLCCNLFDEYQMSLTAL